MPFNLETRTCRCGCGKTLKVLPSSKAWFASKKCIVFYETFGEVKKRSNGLSEADEREIEKLKKLFKGEQKE